MPRHDLKYSDSRTNQARLLKWIALVLVVSNIGLGIFSFYILRRLDRQYSELIDHSVPVLNDLQELTVNALRAMRATNSTAEMAVAGRRDALTKDRAFRVTVLAAINSTVREESHTELRVAGAEFSKIGEEVVNLLSNGRNAESIRLRESVLLTAFDRYVAAVSKASTDLEAESIKVNDAVSNAASRLSSMAVGLGTWPVIFLVGLLLLTVVFLFVLMIDFRGREIGNSP